MHKQESGVNEIERSRWKSVGDYVEAMDPDIARELVKEPSVDIYRRDVA